MENTGRIDKPATVAIGGRLTQTSPQNTVGTSGSGSLSEAHIVNGCETKTQAYNADLRHMSHPTTCSRTSPTGSCPPIRSRTRR